MHVSSASPLAAFDFKAELFGPAKTLSASAQSINGTSGEVVINGVDTAGPSTPFDVDWGDGTAPEQAWFPFQHTYGLTTLNHVVQITAHYDGGGTDNLSVPVRFVAPVLTPIALPPEQAVFIDNSPLSLVSRPYPGYPAPTLSYFDDTFFDVVPRSAIEYVLHLAAYLQYVFANRDVLEVGGGFQQHVLRDPALGGMYSLWFTDPVAFGAGDTAFSGTLQYSSFFHEIGHNITLNFPAAFHYGGRIDGAANAIYSETMAQIFQHATAYEILNAHGYGYTGLEDALAVEIELSARSSMQLVREHYDEFVANGAPFTSWNNPVTPEDETFDTFMTLAYKFFEHAEDTSAGIETYAFPLYRMMKLLALFDANLASLYAQNDNTVEAETFRSTLMVAALSHAFDADLRSEMRALNFPIDDDMFAQLIYENRWRRVNTNETVSRWSHGMVFDSARKKFVVFGGRTDVVLNDTWEFNGNSWSQIATDDSPPARFWHAMVYDSHRQRTVLFGGGDPDNSLFYNDTWEYDGANWLPVATLHSPPPGFVKTMAFDSGRNRTVLILGDAESQTWEYDGADWTLVDTPVAPPPPGALAALAYDAARERTVLTFDDGTPQLATWEYDGSTWAKMDTDDSPLGRWAHAMAYDSCRQRVVLYGGYSQYFEDGSVMEDTWEYTGTEWEHIITPVSAGQWEQHAMAFDSTNCRVILNVWVGTWIYPQPFEIFFRDGFEG